MSINNRILALAVSVSLLTGCAAAPVVVGVGAVAGGVMVAKDRRTTGMMMDDERIELKTMDMVTRDPMLRDNAHINATSFNGQLLLTGEVPDQQSGDKLAAQAAKIERISVVKNAGVTPVIAHYTPIPHTAMWPVAVAASRYDLEADPIYTNNAIFPCQSESFSWEVLTRLKNLARA